MFIQWLSSVLGNVVHPCRDELTIRIVVSMVTGRLGVVFQHLTTKRAYLIKYTKISEKYNSAITLSEGDEEWISGLGLLLYGGTCYYKICSLLMLKDDGCEKCSIRQD